MAVITLLRKQHIQDGKISLGETFTSRKVERYLMRVKRPWIDDNDKKLVRIPKALKTVKGNIKQACSMIHTSTGRISS
jgi:hypothetical protein